MTEHNIGIDISKSHLDAFHLEADDGRRFENSTKGLRALQKWLTSFEVTRIVFEATGPYHRRLETALSGKQPLVKVNPLQARRFAQALGTHAKTDAVDAQCLARMGAALGLEPDEPISENLRDLRDLQRARALAQSPIDPDRHPSEATEQDSPGPGRAPTRRARRRDRAPHFRRQISRAQARHPGVDPWYRPNCSRRYFDLHARNRNSGTKAGWEPGRAGSAHAGVRPMEGQVLYKRWAQTAAGWMHFTCQPSSPCGSTRTSRPDASNCVKPENPRKSRWWPSRASSSRLSTHSLKTTVSGPKSPLAHDGYSIRLRLASVLAETS